MAAAAGGARPPPLSRGPRGERLVPAGLGSGSPVPGSAPCPGPAPAGERRGAGLRRGERARGRPAAASCGTLKASRGCEDLALFPQEPFNVRVLELGARGVCLSASGALVAVVSVFR